MTRAYRSFPHALTGAAPFPSVPLPPSLIIAQRGDTLSVHYIGRVQRDGTVFDNSYDRYVLQTVMTFGRSALVVLSVPPTPTPPVLTPNPNIHYSASASASAHEAAKRFISSWERTR